MKILPGAPYPLGATWDERGVNFAIYSEHATAVDLYVFDEQGAETRVPLRDRTAFVWHAFVPGLKAGTQYGYRVKGPYEPGSGLRFNDQVLLLDPYARALDGHEQWDKGLFAYELGGPEGDAKRSDKPALGAPRGVVIDPRFDWEGDQRPNVALHRMVIYETHVRGLTMKHPEVPEAMRGKYGGVASDPMLEYFKELGVNAIELLPVHAFVDDKTLLDKGLRNYWGYNSIAFFAPETRFRSVDVPGAGVREFKEMVKRLHRAGIEVILDVVYNHTGEGNQLGPSISFKGIDNPTYYRLVPDNPRFYFDYTGTGNTLNVRHPQTLQLIMDSLRYWVTDMHVDGFRFDLASALARSLHDVDQLSSFFTIIHQDPILSQVKLIAEPWDVGEGGYQVGNFPVRWAEWNGKYRDVMREFWKGGGGLVGELAYRLTGSSDLYESDGRRPYSSINFIVAHDGFTLRDLVSYNEKHNDANGEDGRDGATDNASWNCGAEGPSEDAGIRRLRARQQRNLLATLLLSQGTPMICGGDEIGRTQGGNNNAYCQDNEISWHDWALDDERKALLAFTRKVIRIRAEHPALRRAKFFKGRKIRGADILDIMWFRYDGQPMSEGDWNTPYTRALQLMVAGMGLDDTDDEGNRLVDSDLLIIVNAGHESIDFTMPGIEGDAANWELLLDTNDDAATESVPTRGQTHLEGRSLRLFHRPPSGDRPSLIAPSQRG
ncbi:MAG TPA: glycogen debranching protein GlgX [Polyangiaceae bacterium]|jgi:glycogen operon protein|nr:glycogen debranching protein GlgX [Polyangiaceae bacterium]